MKANTCRLLPLQTTFTLVALFAYRRILVSNCQWDGMVY